MLFCRLLIFFSSKSAFSKREFINYTFIVSNSLDLDQASRLVGPVLCPNCLQMSSADDTGRQRVDVNDSV